MTQINTKLQTQTTRDKKMNKLVTAYHKLSTKVQNIARQIKDEIENDDIFWNLTATTQSYSF